MSKPSKKEFGKIMVAEWNVLSFTEYLKFKHEEVFGIPYAPFQGWRAEQGMLGNIIGTKTKERKYDNYIVKNFIDKSFDTYTPTGDYPGTSFGFSWTYRQNVWQQVLAEDKANDEYKEAVNNQLPFDDIMDLL